MKIGRIICFCLLMISLMALFLPGPILAQDEPDVEANIELVPAFRVLEDQFPGASFEFEVALLYHGTETREFELSVTTPATWSTYIQPSFGEQRIRNIRLDPNSSIPSRIKIYTSPPLFLTPEPGEYEIIFEATSGDISNSIVLTAAIVATYEFELIPTTERWNTTATAGKDNFVSIEIINTGRSTLEDIKLGSRKPDGWTIEFTPEKIDLLSPGSTQTVDVNIKPAAKTISGDYKITITVDERRIVTREEMRVTVETPTIWGWVGVGIILAVIAGVAIIFWRFSRR